MEILAELLFGLLGFLFEFFGELLIQLIFQTLFELGAHAFQRKAPSSRRAPVSAPVAALMYFAIGGGIGVLSVLLVPGTVIPTFFGRIANLLLMPFASGAFMALIGAWRRQRGEEIVRIDRFWYGFLFALGMGLVRFVNAQGWWDRIL
ncbi:hypothetical protein GHT07_03845 [Caenimonas koreensis DSM 17982]|uniref:Uncharacterized protein n=1 Tax=Caenimonas koreensis DSM 17982 TaxID=1121255 RepID=A0A844B520_9BURK|nr:hypothetical protein [Caenimonas koreensis]MRD46396.1 hypothetical protein [Caenimonas koreensis DSM 17982]